MSGTAGPGPLPAIDPDVVAAAVRGCRLVAWPSAGRFGEVATYLPGRRVPGVRLGPAGPQVNVVGWYGPTTAEIAEQVRDAVRPVSGGLPVHVVIDDLELDPGDAPAGAAAAG